MGRRAKRHTGTLGSPIESHKHNLRFHEHARDAFLKEAAVLQEQGLCAGAFANLLDAAEVAGQARAEREAITPSGHTMLFDNSLVRAKKAYLKACPVPKRRG